MDGVGGGVILDNPMDGVGGGVLLENPMDGVGGGVLLENPMDGVRGWGTISRVAGPMCPVLDHAMVTTVNFFHGNEFYTARRTKLAWLLLARH